MPEGRVLTLAFGGEAIAAWLPLFLFVILFGLSMDYHVFILSRIREAYDRGLDTDAAGSFDLFYNMTYLTEYEFQETPGGPSIDGRGKRNFQTVGAPAPKWRMGSMPSWSRVSKSGRARIITLPSS